MDENRAKVDAKAHALANFMYIRYTDKSEVANITAVFEDFYCKEQKERQSQDFLRISVNPSTVLNQHGHSKIIVGNGLVKINYPSDLFERKDELPFRLLFLHEIGHLFLNYEKNQANPFDIDKKKECDAIYFAMQFLIHFYNNEETNIKSDFNITLETLPSKVREVFNLPEDW
jgi:hypothetical protein